MTIKEFIEKAIEGGWKYYDIDKFIIKTYEDLHHFYNLSDEKILLDPKAWEAVGKVEGWYCCNLHWKSNDSRCTDCDIPWKRNMHQMIDALIEGKSIEDYLLTL